jgi:periplasmic protein CpxP/Spy
MFKTDTLPLAALGLALCLGTTAGSALAEPLDGHPRGAGRVDAHLERMTEQLDLTETQREDIRALLDEHHRAADQDRALLREQIDAVLTDAQRERRDGLRTEHMSRRLDRLAERLDLSDAQRAEVRAIMDARRADPDMDRADVHEQIAEVLTDAQRAALRELRGPGRGGPGGRDGDALRGPGAAPARRGRRCRRSNMGQAEGLACVGFTR